ncbi:hypothetical protein B0T25DRAFT_94023 [Lasiosphaeria hispida]|uniref:Uncharacterized protein n=1 Tax=Lasiosphaeria hispida TaxID=260671 RepID=A0AAJ0HPZ3_9PEZI|nr:hypothetical protein B0T25DRAFT_94023 [Lasiosphaeria hispida]
MACKMSAPSHPCTGTNDTVVESDEKDARRDRGIAFPTEPSSLDGRDLVPGSNAQSSAVAASRMAVAQARLGFGCGRHLTRNVFLNLTHQMRTDATRWQPQSLMKRSMGTHPCCEKWFGDAQTLDLASGIGTRPRSATAKKLPSLRATLLAQLAWSLWRSAPLSFARVAALLDATLWLHDTLPHARLPSPPVFPIVQLHQTPPSLAYYAVHEVAHHISLRLVRRSFPQAPTVCLVLFLRCHGGRSPNPRIPESSSASALTFAGKRQGNDATA